MSDILKKLEKLFGPILKSPWLEQAKERERLFDIETERVATLSDKEVHDEYILISHGDDNDDFGPRFTKRCAIKYLVLSKEFKKRNLTR